MNVYSLNIKKDSDENMLINSVHSLIDDVQSNDLISNSVDLFIDFNIEVII